MAIQMKIVFEEEVDNTKLNDIIEDLKSETIKIEKRGEVRTFTDVGQAKGGPFEQIIIGIITALLANYIMEKSPEVREHMRKLLKKVFTKVKNLTQKSKIIIRKEAVEIPIELGTEEEIEQSLENIAVS